MELTLKEMSELRVNHAKATKKDSFALFRLGEKKVVSNIAPDNLREGGREIVNDAKERINLHYDDEGDMW